MFMSFYWFTGNFNNKISRMSKFENLYDRMTFNDRFVVFNFPSNFYMT